MSKKILVIDDEPDMLKIMQHTLMTGGYDVATAVNGQEGLEKLEKEKPDLVILDVLMPVMDGFEFFKRVKKDPSKSLIPIMVLTARGGMRYTFESMDADEFIAKPFDSGDLMLKIGGLLSKKVIVLTQDSYIADRMNTCFQKYAYTVEAVPSFEELDKKCVSSKFKAIVLHLAFLEVEPQDFMPRLRAFRNRNPLVVIYSDDRTKGTSSGRAGTLGEIRDKWAKAGAALFFDTRISDKIFADALADIKP